MHPQIHTLLRQPQIRPADALGAHPHPVPHLITLLVADPAIRHRMHHVHPIAADLARQTLRDHPHARTPRPVGGVFGRGAQGAERAREDDRALFAAARLRQGRCAAVVGVDAFEALLGEGERAGGVGLEGGAEGGGGLGEEGRLVGVFDVVDGEFEGEGGEVGVGFDGGEGVGEVGGRGVGGKGVYDCGGGELAAEGAGQGGEVFGVAGEEGDGVVAFCLLVGDPEGGGCEVWAEAWQVTCLGVDVRGRARRRCLRLDQHL